MTTTVRQVREAVADILTGINGLTVSPFPTFALFPPHAIVKEDELDYRQVFSTTLNAFGLSIIVFMSTADEQSSQYFLDDLAEIDGTNSVRRLLEDENSGTLGGLVDFIAVDAASVVEIRLSAQDPNVLYLTREWTCRVNVTNT